VPQPNPNQEQQQNEPDVRTVVVSVNEGGQLLINQDPVTKPELGARLTDIFRTRADRTMFVRGDPEVLFAEVAEVIDIAKGAQVDKIGLITKNIEAGQ
jgi:biopolymer transport protein ExbD